jgi:hypothetical protein
MEMFRKKGLIIMNIVNSSTIELDDKGNEKYTLNEKQLGELVDRLSQEPVHKYKCLKKKIKECIQTTLVVKNKQSIDLAVEKIYNQLKIVR